MSDQNRNDWNDDLDFESLADEHDTGSDFADEDLSDFEDSVYGTDEPAEEEAPVEAEIQEPTPVKARKRGGVSGGWLGFMFGTAILVSALGLASAVALLTGVDPLSLWNPSGLTAFDQVINFQDHPQNLLYLVGVGILLLMVLGSAAVARSARSTNARLATAEDMLAKVTALRLENEDAWAPPAFKADPECASFVAETLGSWRMQQSRQKRLLGLEGELHRLSKSVADGTSAGPAGRFDNPAVGAVSDEFTRLMDELASAHKIAEEAVNKDQDTAESTMELLQDARTWNHATLDSLGVQGAALEQVAQKVGLLAAKVSEASEGSGGQQGLVDDLKALADQPGGGTVQGAAAAAAELDQLVEKGSKLAFQIAMEVARLGQRGERLLPMTKALEGLTTSFRQAAAGLKTEDEGTPPSDTGKADGLEAVIARLETNAQTNWAELGQLAAELGPRAGNVSEGLGDLADGFNLQEDRLRHLGSRLSDLTGLEFKAEDLKAGRADNPPEGSLKLASSDPFAIDAPGKTSAPEVDPFLSSTVELPGEPDGSPDDVFTTSESAARDSIFGDAPDPVIEPVAEPEPAPVVDIVPEAPEMPEVSEVESPQAAPPVEGFSSGSFGDIELSAEEEKVYDLADFDAVRIDTEEASDTDRIYDLSEFGAVRVG